MRDFLGNTLADHYMSDLYQSADNYGLDSSNHERVHGSHFSLSHHRTVELLENMLGRESAATNLMNASLPTRRTSCTTASRDTPSAGRTRSARSTAR